MRTRETIEAQVSDITQKTSEKKYGRGQHPNSKKNIKPWQPGQSGNPGGKPKTDMAQIIARAVFENNPVVLYQAYSKALAKGQAFAFQVLSDRAYGKLKEVRDTGSELNEVPDGELQAEIERIMSRLELAREADAAANAGVAKARAEKANGAAKDRDVLPR